MARSMVLGIAVSALLIGSATARADDLVEGFALENVDALVAVCTTPPEHPLGGPAKGFCLGYMTGVMQLYGAATHSPEIENAVCPGRTVPRAEMRDLFVAWAAAHPEHLEAPAVEGVMRAAIDAFPCS